MIRKARTNIKKSIGITITLLSLVIITIVLASCLQQPNYIVNAATIDNQSLKQQTFLETNLADSNKTTNGVEVANLYHDYSSVVPTKTSNSSDNPKFATNKQPDSQRQQFHSLPDFTNQVQTIESNGMLPISYTSINEEESLDPTSPNNNYSETPIIAASSSLGTLNFNTYAYGGYSVQHPEPNQLFFSFPDNTNQGQISGSDAITLNTYSFQKIDFDAVFISPKINALGFDEMAIFATSNTITYKGTEFGIRLDLNDGFIYGYNQEPNVNDEDVNFQMLKLALNDGAIHHYSIIMLGSEVAFYIDGIDTGHLTFPSQTDYSNLPFSILAVVHRFTDDWDSTGDNMTVENFNLNSQ